MSAHDTGIVGIDYEPRRLVKMLNEIHDLIVKDVKPHKISDTLANFHALATAHFVLEEKITHLHAQRSRRYLHNGSPLP